MFLEWENNSGKLQIISGKFQNNAINDVKQISLSHVINDKINYIHEVALKITYQDLAYTFQELRNKEKSALVNHIKFPETIILKILRTLCVPLHWLVINFSFKTVEFSVNVWIFRKPWDLQIQHKVLNSLYEFQCRLIWVYIQSGIH